MPWEDQRDRGIVRHLAPLAAVVVGEEGEAAIVEHLEQDKPGGRPAFRCGGCEDECVGLVNAGRDCLLEPQMKERERVRAGLVLGEAAHGVLLPHRGDSPRRILFGGAHFFSSR
jgi:hypothetical protein